MATSGRDKKPTEYNHSCVVKQPIHYNAVDGLKGHQSSVGTLQIGRVVWLDHDLVATAMGTRMQAYVDGLGLILVDPENLSAIC